MMNFKEFTNDIKKSIDDGTISDKISELAEKGNTPIDGKCPNCSAPLELTTNQTVCTCRYCGTQIDVVTGKNTVDKVVTLVVYV